jgi:anti-anti-sigma regulatory factor
MTLMLSPPDPAADLGAVCLSGHATTVTAEDLQARLVAASDYADATQIDASELLSVGQAVLQLLIAARTEADVRERSFGFVAASAAFSERVTSCQLADAIGLEAGKDITQ